MMQSHPSVQRSPEQLTHEPMHQTRTFCLCLSIAFQMLSLSSWKGFKDYRIYCAHKAVAAKIICFDSYVSAFTDKSPFD